MPLLLLLAGLRPPALLHVLAKILAYVNSRFDLHTGVKRRTDLYLRINDIEYGMFACSICQLSIILRCVNCVIFLLSHIVVP
ncbi:hypothetical protein OnM2_c1084o50 [Erysiphe neolycopersici]|uniref:Secreted protein n=1 Tax=Erysiphe neolycopersici TaxID=212602 RepID=A0A420I722_9PEZI|nr:hypothetical protein OnM2_c1084o50 [Erysiphe neolycopersici]